MPADPAFRTWLHSAYRNAAFALRALLVVSIVLFGAQPASALATHHTMKSPGAGIAFLDANASHANVTQSHDTDCCQPAEPQPACPDCAAVFCAAASATLATTAAIRIVRQPLRHAFFDPAFALSSDSQPPELGPPRA